MLRVNDGQKVSEQEFDLSLIYKNNRLEFEGIKNLIGSGEKTVMLSIQYQFHYSLTREGLNIYREAQEAFVYSQLIFHCWAVFPCFDQPDIKAVLKLRLLAPTDWEVASNAELIATEKHNSDTE